MSFELLNQSTNTWTVVDWFQSKRAFGAEDCWTSGLDLNKTLIMSVLYAVSPKHHDFYYYLGRVLLYILI